MPMGSRLATVLGRDNLETTSGPFCERMFIMTALLAWVSAVRFADRELDTNAVAGPGHLR